MPGSLHHSEVYLAVPTQILRALFLVNDRCSSEGLVWRPRRCVLLPHVPHLTSEGDVCANPCSASACNDTSTTRLSLQCALRKACLSIWCSSLIFYMLSQAWRIQLRCVDHRSRISGCPACFQMQALTQSVLCAELRGGGSGRQLMRVYSKGCTMPGYEAAPAFARRHSRRTTGAPFCMLNTHRHITSMSDGCENCSVLNLSADIHVIPMFSESNRAGTTPSTVSTCLM